MDFGVLAFIAGMLAFGYLANPFMAIAMAVCALVFFIIGTETKHKKMRSAGLTVGLLSALISVSLTVYSSYSSMVAQQLQQAQYEQYYNQYYGTGEDGVTADDTDGAEAPVVESPTGSANTGE